VSDTAAQAILTTRLAEVEARLLGALRRAGRSRREVTLVAVTKTVGPAVAALLPMLGVHDLGENRPQELWRKAAILPAHIRWHLIGHLQRNKVERTLPLVVRLHAVDSLRLLQTIEEEASRRRLAVEVLLEVNASGETSKFGFAPDEVPGLVESLEALRWVRVGGLMTMAAPEADPERTRPTFARLRQLRDALRPALEPVHPMTQLSMGMSNDFEVAVEEGATLIRLGTVLFEGLGEVRPG
jgi:pyridoxal phosphate enzyme (YggS family)